MFQDNSDANLSSSNWSFAQDKLFERAIVLIPEETPDRWKKVAEKVPGKTPEEVEKHYEALVHDVMAIEAGRIELPRYTETSYVPSWVVPESPLNQISFQQNKQKHSESERKKGVPWTEEEHRLFLAGLHKFGKGDWRSISRNAVVSRTPTQVASHAQKYFLRLNSMKKDKKRSSIHDITTVDNDSVAMAQPNSMVTQPNDPNWVGSQAVLQQIPMGQPSISFPNEGGSSAYQRFGFPPM